MEKYNVERIYCYKYSYLILLNSDLSSEEMHFSGVSPPDEYTRGVRSLLLQGL